VRASDGEGVGDGDGAVLLVAWTVGAAALGVTGLGEGDVAAGLVGEAAVGVVVAAGPTRLTDEGADHG
jgi:hypothetical protein